MNCGRQGCGGAIVDGYCGACGLAPREEPPATATKGSARSAGRRPSGATWLAADLVELPAISVQDPATALMSDPQVRQSSRFCAACDEPVGRDRDGAPGRVEGFCRRCGAAFSFTPKLASSDVVAGQYEVIGPLAHGGMGWVYLAEDRNVDGRPVVLKGVLNTADEDAVAAALNERRFLAKVDHPKIVTIHNFVQHESSGYIVMEFVGGWSLAQILRKRRKANGNKPNPLPVAEAIAYIVEILPALGYLHRLGLLFCDFKLDNVIQTANSLKLIDLGGVYRMDDSSSPIYGTVGYQAPEIAQTGPSIASDLFTVARTLALLCIEFPGYQSQFKFTLPARGDVPLFMRFDSLHRLLLKATTPDPEDRFQSADEMFDQLRGVLREVLADERGRPVTAPSTLFTGDFRANPDRPDPQLLPLPQDASDDPAADYLATLATTEPAELVALLRAVPDPSVAVKLRIARAMSDTGDLHGAQELLAEIEARTPREWRVAWYRGLIALATDRPPDAVESFGVVYCAVPGELAPRLALGVVAELAGDHLRAAAWYERVTGTDPAYTTATFGLARCRTADGDPAAALGALKQVPASSSSHIDAQMASIRCLIAHGDGVRHKLDALRLAGARLESLSLAAEQRARLTSDLLRTALDLLDQGAAAADPDVPLLGHRLVEHDLRIALEHSYRELARGATNDKERIRLVDFANRVRPMTWT